jgi:hypothetical protein
MPDSKAGTVLAVLVGRDKHSLVRQNAIHSQRKTQRTQSHFNHVYLVIFTSSLDAGA